MPGLRVFLSSTATDLVEYRRIADDTLLRLQQQSVVMERFGPLPGAPVVECERLAAEADVVICIVAHRYGYEPEAGRGSITRREVEAATAAGRPVYAWIIDDAHPWAGAKEQDRLIQSHVLADRSRTEEILEALRGLQDFKAWLRRNVVTDVFTTPDDLGRRIATALATVRAGQGARPTPRPQLSVVHALQPSPHFRGREGLVDALSGWIGDFESVARIYALIAAGGTGKTAVVQRVIAQLQHHWPESEGGRVLVWSFYENPAPEAFLATCLALFCGEQRQAPTDASLERLQAALGSGQAHVLVLDGLERMQADGATRRLRGELVDQRLRLLLQAIAGGLGRTRALVTSRFSLTDLRDWPRSAVVEVALEDLSRDAACDVLRDWGVRGNDSQFAALTEQVGRHALSLAVIGSYVSHFESGRIEGAAGLELDAAAGDDPKAAKLARVLDYYATRLAGAERELLKRFSMSPRGVTLEFLHSLVDAGGEAARGLGRDKPRLRHLITRLEDLGLIYRSSADAGTPTWTAHPFLRERFANFVDGQHEEISDVEPAPREIRLDQKPVSLPESTSALDGYEELIDATRLAGRMTVAFDIYEEKMGGARHLGERLGDYARVWRILNGFLPATGDMPDFAATLDSDRRMRGFNALGVAAHKLGRLGEALEVHRAGERLGRRQRGVEAVCVCLQNVSLVNRDLGRLRDALHAAEEATDLARTGADGAMSRGEMGDCLGLSGSLQHLVGALSSARGLYELAGVASMDGEQDQMSSWRVDYARHLLDLGEHERCASVLKVGLSLAETNRWNSQLPAWDAVSARLALAQDGDPAEEMSRIRTWATRSVDCLIESFYIAARVALRRVNFFSARAAAEDGLREARRCGFTLRQVELLVTLSVIHMGAHAPGTAQECAQEALNLAVQPHCRYAWGEADAAHACGLAFEALGQREHAQRALKQAVTVRERIEHPQADSTRAALQRVS